MVLSVLPVLFCWCFCLPLLPYSPQAEGCTFCTSIHPLEVCPVAQHLSSYNPVATCGSAVYVLLCRILYVVSATLVYAHLHVFKKIPLSLSSRFAVPGKWVNAAHAPTHMLVYGLLKCHFLGFAHLRSFRYLWSCCLPFVISTLLSTWLQWCFIQIHLDPCGWSNSHQLHTHVDNFELNSSKLR